MKPVGHRNQVGQQTLKVDANEFFAEHIDKPESDP